jgi:hypothetical protein
MAKLHVLSGQAAFDEGRNTSRGKAVDPNVVPQFIKMCADARARGEAWIKWIDDGCPELSQAEFERTTTHRKHKRG